MPPDKKGNSSNRIPVNFFDSDSADDPDALEGPSSAEEFTDHMDDELDITNEGTQAFDLDTSPIQPSPQADGSPAEAPPPSGGPEVAELVATRAELKRLEAEVKDLRESLAPPAGRL